METVLFVCTHNSARSQMAEGLLRHFYGDRYIAQSAGTAPRGVHPLAHAAMAELGIDLSDHTSQHLDDFTDQAIEYVVTVCDHAREACPYFPATKQNLHHSFPDPSAVDGTDADRLTAFRTVRDTIRHWLSETFDAPQNGSS